MDWEIVEEPPGRLDDYCQVPISFLVHRCLDVRAIDSGLGGIALDERAVEPAYIKDYDAIEGSDLASRPGGHAASCWGVLSAFDGGVRVGGALVVAGATDVEMLEGRDDLAVLWDLRVHPDHRRRGLGRRLFLAAEGWARSRGCRHLKVETQNINVPACRFYAARGCVLGAIRRFAYPAFPDEVQLLWYKDLGGPAGETETAPELDRGPSRI